MIAVIKKEKIRFSIIEALKILFDKKIFSSFIFIFIYTAFWIYIMSNFSIWDYKYVKDIVLWVLFIGLPLCFNAVDTDDNFYYIAILKKNLNAIIFIEFVISIYTFNLLAEFLLVPFITLLVFLHAISKTDTKYEKIEKLLTFFQVVFGYTILYLALKNILEYYNELNKIELIVTFSIPLVMTIIFLPLAYIFSLISNYEQLFLRMTSRLPKSEKINRKIKCKVILKCKISLKRIVRFRKYILSKMHKNMTLNELGLLLDEFEL